MSDKETKYPGTKTFRVSYPDGKTNEFTTSEHDTAESWAASYFGGVDPKEFNVKVELVQTTKPAAKAGTPAAKAAPAPKGVEKQLEDAIVKEADGQAASKPE